MNTRTSIGWDAFITKLDEIIDLAYNKPSTPGATSMDDSDVLKQDTLSQASELKALVRTIGEFEGTAEGDDYNGDTFELGPQKEVYSYKFTKEVPITEEAIEDEKFSLIAKNVKKLGENARKTDETDAFELFRGAFDATSKTTAHGKAICDDTNTTLSGDAADNKMTEALAASSLEEAIQKMNEMKGHDGTVSSQNAKTLLVPGRLWKTAIEITESPLVPGSANNDINVFSAKYDINVKWNKYLSNVTPVAAVAGKNPARTAGSTTAWFLLADEHTLTRYVRSAFKYWYDNGSTRSNNSSAYRAKYRTGYEAIDFLGVIGSDGTA